MQDRKNDKDRYEIFVESVVEGSNAEKAGVQAGDVLRANTAVFQV